MQAKLTVNEKHWPVTHEGVSVIDFLYDVSGLSKNKIKQVMQKGAVWHSRGQQEKRIRRANKQLEVGDTVHLYYDEKILNAIPPKPELIADEVDYSIWCKPYGLFSQGSRWGDHCTINRWVEQNHLPQRPAFIVHRLDRAASGLMIIAHSKKMAAAFSAMFREGQINKSYRAWVHGCFPETDKPVTYEDLIDGKMAISHVNRLEYDSHEDISLLNVNIETGRKHQIRKHLSMHGFPIMGDRLYGNDTGDCDLKLTSYELSFISPVDGSSKQYCLDKL